MQELLKIQQLKKYFKKNENVIRAVDDVDLSIMENEWVALIGESGSGKTTIANIIAGFVLPDAGRFFYDGQMVFDSEAAIQPARGARRSIQMVFQNARASFSNMFSVYHGISEGINYYGNYSREEKRQKVEQAAEMVQLPKSCLSKKPSQISGGECQRAAIARAIISEPKLLICDEMTSALDVCVQKDIMDLMVMLRKETGMAYLFISHDLALVKNYADRVCVMRKGILEETGSCRDIFANPSSGYTRKLIDSAMSL